MKEIILYLRNLGMAALLGLAAMPAAAQPDWSVVPNNFEYTMTITAIVKIECLESLDTNDLVAAFIGDEVRGVQRFRDLYNGQLFAFMIVYDNAFSGNPIHFKLYDASADMIIDALDQLTFIENQNAGSTEEPFIFNTTPGIDKVILNQDHISPNLQAQELAVVLDPINETSESATASFTWINDAAGLDNQYFTILGNELYLAVDADEIDHEILHLHLIATPINGCSFDFPFELSMGEVTATHQPKNEVDQFRIYPNPTDGMIHWDGKVGFDFIMAYDVSGKLIFHSKLNSTSTMDLSILPEGIYIVKFIGKGIQQVTKLIKN